MNFRLLHALLRAVLPLDILLADSREHAAADAGVGLVDRGFAPVKARLRLIVVLFQNSGGVQLTRHRGGFLSLTAFGEIPQLRGGLHAEIGFQLFLARGEIADVFLQGVQQREHFIDARQAIHNRSSLFSTTPPVCP